jgi:cysteine desulfurase/selenocysteine lyase
MRQYRDDFQILNKKVNDKSLIYFDNAATTQKPNVVLNAMKNYNEIYNANAHRGSHTLSVEATELYEKSRYAVKEFINAKFVEEIIFTKNTTESLNLIAYSYGMDKINKNDEILISVTNHHSNILPWQMVAKSKEAKLIYMYTNEEGQIPYEEIENKINKNTKIVSIPHVNNALGVIHPIEKIISKAHENGAIVVLDIAQSVPHMKIDIQNISPDFAVFSGHKMLGPMSIGVMYGKRQILESMNPFLFGGDMIEYVTEQDATYAQLPHKFEAGTQNVEGAVGLMEAINYINKVGIENIEKREKELLEYALNKLKKLEFVKLYGPKDKSQRTGVISFNIKDVHSHDVSSILDSYGVAIRSGHHCAQPFMKHMNVNSTARASFYFYNIEEEIDIFIEALKNVRKWLGYES